MIKSSKYHTHEYYKELYKQFFHDQIVYLISKPNSDEYLNVFEFDSYIILVVHLIRVYSIIWMKEFDMRVIASGYLTEEDALKDITKFNVPVEIRPLTRKDLHENLDN